MYEINYLSWDSNFFNRNIYDLSFCDDINNANYLNIREELNAKISALSYSVIQSKVNISNLNAIHLLEGLSFNFINTHLTFVQQIKQNYTKHDSKYKFRLAEVSDKPDLSELLKGIYKHSRFKYIVDKDKVDEFYVLWGIKAIEGLFDDFCLLATKENEICGAVSCKVINNYAKIGIVGIKENFRGLGVGGDLINNLCIYLYDRKIYKVYVTTEGTNIPAINLYIKNDFKIYNTDVIMYLFNYKYHLGEKNG